ncbi:hypothetical protein [Halomarina rubra]|uniref:Uncharacterized protein n=1 Tax=Halomarina rubra TaxID=2071873 RepID=A0ABD6B223_9EURY|nr:hypothetical protein [Halomarina rubra]
MKPKDDVILAYLARIYPSAEPPKVIHWNLEKTGEADWVQMTTQRRLKKMEGHSPPLVEIVNEKGGYRRITDAGIAKLRELETTEEEY